MGAEPNEPPSVEELDGSDFEAGPVETLEAANSANDSIVMKDGTVFRLQTVPLTPEQEAQFAALTSAERDEFFQRRNRSLTLVARSLYRSPTLLGWIMETPKGLIRWTRKNQENANETISFKELGVQRIQRLLESLDTRFWDSINHNVKTPEQRGVIATAAVSLGSGFLKAGLVKGYQLGVGIGYNKASQAIYLETFLLEESFDKALTFAATAYIGVHGGTRSEYGASKSGVRIINRSGSAWAAPLFFVYTNPQTRIWMSGWGAEVFILTRFLQVYELYWRERGFRVSFSIPRFLQRRRPAEKCREVLQLTSPTIEPLEPPEDQRTP